MAGDNQHRIRNGIIITVVSAAILYGATFIPGLYRWFVNLLLWSGRFFAEPVTIGRWLFTFACLLAAVTVIRFVRPLFRRGKRERGVSDYRTDRFFGLVWRWTYGFGGQPQGIWCFCPDCDTQLVYTQDRFPDRIWLTCEYCNRRLYEADGTRDYVVSQVYRQIDRKIRNGSWKNASGQVT